ncbi:MULTISPECIES: 23S rRNA (guanosine(2251)-2'-O)-methyltransferase RlmB [unclassified Moraxella]|uniref:23S rRNA (guanosine(2251)-2'-O)-methyltransferase RlmB n=1 Tax=unclassified Moraxella TaxID=2685852 RepID=UPI003AF80D7A
MAKPLYFYGIHAVQALLEQRGMDGVALFVQDGKKPDAHLEAILELAKQYGISVQTTAKDRLTKLAESPQHQGVVLQARPANLLDEADLRHLIDSHQAKQQPILLLILDQITDPNNLGACIRTAVAMGVSAVIIPKNNSSTITPAVAKVAVGAVEIMPFVQVTNLARTLTEIKKQGVFVFGTALDETAKAVQDCDLTGDVAIVMGSEGDGIRRLTADTCDQLVYIPMVGSSLGKIESLNVSVATGMVLYEASRQRCRWFC